MIGTVLLAVGPDDGDRLDDLVQQASNLARPADATVVVGHVIPRERYEEAMKEYDDAIDQVGLDVRKQDLPPERVAKDTDPVSAAIDRLETAGIDVEIGVAIGDRTEEIGRLAEESNADILIIGGRKRSPTGKAMFGSTAQTVLLNAPCPVTYVRDQDE